MKVILKTLLTLCCLSVVNTLDAQEPELQNSWIEDSQGNITDAPLSVGDIVTLVITANKAADGELITIDLEGMSCSYRLLDERYKIKNGVIKGVMVNGDNHENNNTTRPLNNQTRLRFITIRETQQCLDTLETNRIKANTCYKKSWPYRRWTHKTPRVCEAN